MLQSLSSQLIFLRTVSVSRWLRLICGLSLFGVGIALMKVAQLGLGPWDVMGDGLSRLTGLSLGTLTIIIGACVLFLWLFIDERPGIGTVANILLIGLAVNATLALLPEPELLPVRAIALIGGLLLIGLGSALYLGAKLGAGPRDGLMMGLHRKYGWSVRTARTLIEVTVLAIGALLGGSVGVGTLVFALGIGPVVQFMIKLVGRLSEPQIT